MQRPRGRVGVWAGGEEGRRRGEPRRALSVGTMWTEPCGLCGSCGRGRRPSRCRQPSEGRPGTGLLTWWQVVVGEGDGAKGDSGGRIESLVTDPREAGRVLEG